MLADKECLQSGRITGPTHKSTFFQKRQKYGSSFRFLTALCLTLTLPFASAQALSFTRVASGPIQLDTNLTRGVCFVDYDGDDYADLFFTNEDEPDVLLRNNGDGTFTKITSDPIVALSASSDASTWGDIDHDGDIDCLVSTWKGQRDLLFLNNGDGTFSQDTTSEILNTFRYSDYAGWTDFGRDGDLDLYVSVGFGSQLNQFYEQQDDGSFTEPLTGNIVEDAHRSHGLAWGDYDNDGDQDVFAVNVSGNNSLYRNEGDTLFSKVTTGPMVNDGMFSLRCNWGDYDNDGDLDQFVTNGASQINAFYSNNGDGSFTQIVSGNPVVDVSSSHSSIWADLDNDGDLDLFVTNAFGNVQDSNYLYINNGDSTFTKLASDPIVTDTGWSLGASVADIDHDGDLDIAIAKALGFGEPNAIYLNDGNSNHWLAIRLEGVIGVPGGIGARIRVRANISGSDVWQMREIQAPTAFGQQGLVAWFGLGDATEAESVYVAWPSGLVTILEGISADQRLVIDDCGLEDPDGDSVGALCDNCPDIANASQSDLDLDTFGDACDLCPALATILNEVIQVGNVNGDLVVTSSDIIYLVNHVFKGGAQPGPVSETGDVNCDGVITSADIIGLVNYVFKGGAAPCDVCTP